MILRNFQEGGDFTWRVSDCEELVGLLTGDDGGGNYITLKWNFVRFEERLIWFKVIYFFLRQL